MYRESLNLENKFLESMFLSKGYNLSFVFSNKGVYIYTINNIKISSLDYEFKLGLKIATREDTAVHFDYLWPSKLLCDLIIFCNKYKDKLN